MTEKKLDLISEKKNNQFDQENIQALQAKREIITVSDEDFSGETISIDEEMLDRIRNIPIYA